MLHKFRTHVRHNVVGYLALFVALGGTAYAGATIGAGDIQTDAVRSRHVLDHALRSRDVAIREGTFTRDTGELDPGECRDFEFDSTITGLNSTDDLIVTPDGGPEGGGAYDDGTLIATATVTSGGALDFRTCNVGTAAVDPPNTTFSYLVIR